jgi:sterol desaturase/sphingolipid hydroxylase (fatty acid hydroxylase superfamily)
MLLVPSIITPWKVSLEVPLGVPSFLVAGMTPHTTPRTSIFFFSFAIVKSVDVHCRLWLPRNPVRLIFHNTASMIFTIS